MGLRGDTQPLAALAVGLQRRGFAVHMIGASRYAHTLSGTGVEFSALEPDFEELLLTPDGQRWLASGENSLAFARWMRQVVGSTLERLLHGICTAAQPSDCVIYSTFALPAESLAERWGVPSFIASCMPAHPTRAFPAIGFRRPLGPIGNVLSLSVSEQAVWQVFRTRINAWRKTSLGLPPWPLTGPLAQRRREKRPTLYCYSPSVLPAPRDWPPTAHVTGYWQFDPPCGWAPPSALSAFLDAAGPPVVYVGFGSMVTDAPQRRYEMVRSSLLKAGVRGILLGDPETMPSDDLLQVVSTIPHTWLFPRVSAVVHHGGPSTVGAGLRAGLPTVTCPHFIDQPFWAARVHALGAGPRPLPAPRLTPLKLAVAIEQAVTDETMRHRAEQLGQRLRQESGIQVACDIVERSLDASRPLTVAGERD
ncbi:glycosyltransferase [Streptomyces sp. NPDC029080]|uniref:glycosyltransferase n=1 Tax=Streptomyces sp. NPDC029080 TaxID=3155017 RepID=UPI0033C21348